VKNQGHFINNYKVKKSIGSGVFSEVKLCKDVNTGKEYAIKIINKKKLMKEKIGKTKFAFDLIKEEMKVLQSLNHPNILWLNEIIDDPDNDFVYLITNFCSKGSLGDKLKLINQ
jgi:serine/threonine protein kinase